MQSALISELFPYSAIEWTPGLNALDYSGFDASQLRERLPNEGEYVANKLKTHE